jgi:hypothetical protein
MAFLWWGPTISVALAKDLQDGEWVFTGPEEGIFSTLETKLVPALPMLVLGFGPLKSDSSLDILINSAEVSAEDIGLRSWQRFHGKVCGNLDSKTIQGQ